MPDDDLLIKASLRDEVTGPLRRVKDEVDDTRHAVNRLDRAGTAAGRGGISKLAGAGKMAAKVLGGALVVGAAAAVTALGAAAAGIAMVGAKSITLAVDAGETASKFKTVFAGMGDDVDKWVKKTNAAYGITTKDLQDATSRFGIFGKAAGVAAKDLPGFSTSLAGAGLDLASFYNVSPEEAFTALSSGLAGEAEPLRKYGIFLSDASMKAKAATMGLTGELTEAQKVAVRQKLILENLGDANGDLARTSDSVANKWRALKGRGTELLTAIGTGLLPIVSTLTNALDDKLAPVVTRVTDLAPGLADAFKAGDLNAATYIIDGMVGAGGRLKPILDKLIGAAKAVGPAFSAFGGAGVAAVLGDLVGQGPAAVELFNKIKDVGSDLATIYTDLVTPALENLGPAALVLANPLTLIDDVVGFIADHASTLVPVLTAAAAGMVAWKVASTAYNVVGKVTALVSTAQALASGEATAATFAQAAAQKGMAVASKAWAAAQWLVNAAMSANPIGLVIAAVIGLVAGAVLLYKKWKPFRDLVDKIGRAIRDVAVAAFEKLKTAAAAVGGFLTRNVWPILKAIGGFYFGVLRTALGVVLGLVRTWWSIAKPVLAIWVAIGRIGLAVVIGAVRTVIGLVTAWWNITRPVRELLLTIGGIAFAGLKAAVGVVIGLVGQWWDKAQQVAGILRTVGGFAFAVLKSAISTATNLIGTLWEKTQPVRDVIRTIGAFGLGVLTSALRTVRDILSKVAEYAKKAADLITTIANAPGSALAAINPFGDTTRPRARGHAGRARAPRNLAATHATHRALDAASPGRRTITSGYRSWALGSGNSDHATGRALDLVGSGLGGYKRNVEAAGGYAAFHGSGSSRHLHAAIGDSTRPRATGSSAPAVEPPIVFGPGAIVINDAASTVDLEAAIAGGIRRHLRDRRERANI